MSIRKRTWTTAKGEVQEAWIVDYVDAQGKRRGKNFKRQKDAKAWFDANVGSIREGTHVADSASITVSAAGKLWIDTAQNGSGDRDPLERTTVDQYKQHMRLHIEPLLGRVKLSQLTAPAIRKFAEELREQGRSATMVKYVIRSLGALLAEAQESGLVGRNAVHELRTRRRKRTRGRQDRNGKLQVGVDIPAPEEIGRMIRALEVERFRDKVWRPLFLTAIYTGLRASELRGLRWTDVELSARPTPVLHVRQRADIFRAIGKPKTNAGERTLPLPPIVVNALKQWKLRCPKGTLGLVFPNGEGKVEFHVNIIERGLKPLAAAAGLTVPAQDGRGKPQLDENGVPLAEPKYSGMHALRHFFASWCINSKENGGLGLSPKDVQYRMGHSSITVTFDTYGHLFPTKDDHTEFAASAAALAGLHAT